MPASGYYEWRTVEGSKQPYFISAADGSILSIAGLWDELKDLAMGETISSATLIITAANDFTRSIHELMPSFSAKRIMTHGGLERLALKCCDPRRMIFCTCGQFRSV